MPDHVALLALCVIAALLVCGCAGLVDEGGAEGVPERKVRQDMKLWYRTPARDYNSSLPIGNGRLSATVFGGMATERIALNEDTLWSGGPHCYDNPEAIKHLPGVRKLIAEGRFGEAEGLAQKMLGVPKYQQCYLPLGDLFIRFPTEGEPSDYRRELDLGTAVARVTYRMGDAVFTREVFASNPDQVIVVRLTCDKPGRISFDLAMTSPHPSTTKSLAGGVLSMTGKVGPREESRLIGPWKGDGLRFEARVRVATEGGEVASEGERVTVKGADSATLLCAAATSFVNYGGISADPAERVEGYLAAVAGKPFDRLRADHVNDHKKLFGRVELDLGGRDAALRPTDERLRALAEGSADPHLAALLFQYGRYLLIASSRPGTQPANLQGVWNDNVRPPWGSKYTININIQMNYWPAEVCNLGECHEPLFGMIRDLARTGARTARIHYGARGWVAHHNTDLWRGAAPVDGARWGMWPTGGAWFCQHLWERYLYSGDEAHLKRAYPLMKGAAEFFVDSLVEDASGHLVTSPSISPEHSHGGGLGAGRRGASICRGPTMDMQILRDLFANCIEASRILGVDEEFRAKLAGVRARFAPMKVGKHDQLQEWLDDWDNPRDTHGHVSHLYGLYPSAQISLRGTPELARAAEESLVHRGEHGGWPGAWRVALWARLGDGERAHRILTGHVMRGLSDNMWNAGRVFQIDANFGATAGIAEMLLQSHAGELDILPALPKAWPAGRVTGLRARGGFEVDIEWKGGGLVRAVMRSSLGRSCKVRCGEKTIELDTRAGESRTLDGRLLSM